MQEDVGVVSRWSVCNKFTLNAHKSLAMVVGPSSDDVTYVPVVREGGSMKQRNLSGTMLTQFQLYEDERPASVQVMFEDLIEKISD
ncbi:hypothetical protein Bhyg_11402 [Pseudolycoriella hygida]|uniref:Uncharacterized protein n=1 Tax=Pseudolycoriella hygida TaxID=35572 RepID=A0A9Q0MVH5_9DIPT|nr:hypothetical protein Bhyg_11402 [Pseudolycoriella hygida]